MAWNTTWLFLGSILWLVGFLRVGHEGEKQSPLYRAFVRPPFLIYFICGMPRDRNVPRGVMAVAALIGQLEGLLCVFYGLIYSYVPNQNLVIHGVFLLVGMILVIGLIWVFYKNNPYIVE